MLQHRIDKLVRSAQILSACTNAPVQRWTEWGICSAEGWVGGWVVEYLGGWATDTTDRAPDRCWHAHWASVIALKLGFRYLNSGYFSDVFLDVDSGKVVKVCHKSSKDLWVAYAGLCMMNRGQPLFPVVESVTSYDPHYVAAVMIRYYKPGDVPDYDGWLGVKPMNTVSKLLRAAISGDAGGWDVDTSVLENLTPAETLSLRKIHDFVGQEGAVMDLHDDNWMVDDEGGIVITDPVSFADGYSE